MAIRRCSAGEHTYDDSQHSSCPYCRKTRLTTPPGGNDANDIPPPEQQRPVQAKTTPAPGVGGGQRQGNTSSKTRIIFDGGAGGEADFGEVMPVVGWLVVVKGEGQGNDLRITPGMNSIGRERGDIVLDFGEGSISREKHAFLAYDPDDNNFMIAHGEGKNLTKINGKMIMGTQELNPYDRIKIGSTELMFVPLCGDNFSWNETAEESDK